MKLRRFLAVLAFFLAISTQVYSQPLTQRNPVLEYCTGTWCQWCPCGHQIIKENILSTIPNAVVIGYHGPANSANDPWTTFTGNSIISGLGMSSYPTGIIDRTSAPISRSAWLGAMQARQSVNATVAIEVVKNFNATTRELTASVKVNPLLSLSGVYRVNVIILESGMVYSQTGNASCAGNSAYTHNHVVRGFLNHYLGDTLSSGAWEPGQLVTKNYSYSVPAAFNVPNCEIAVLVHKVGSTLNTSEIQQGIMLHVENAPIVVSYPNGGEIMYTGAAKNIVWAPTTITNLNLSYSTNNGSTWSSVATQVAGSAGSYAWTVPNTPSTQCKIKITDASNNTVYDESNSTFSIIEAPTTGWSSITSGTTGDIWGIDYLDANNVWICSSTGDVKKSTDGGATFTAAGNAGEGAYSIAVLNPTTAVVCLGPSAGDGKIMRTTNGGTNWTQVYTTAGAWFNFIDNLDANNAWAVSDPIGGVFHIVKTTDGGATWSLTQNRPTAPASNVYGANNAWYAIGNTLWFGTGGATGATAANKLYRSTTGFDGPWTVATATAQFTGSMAFSSANGKGLVGFWQATNTMNKSTDGGVTLSALTTTNGLTHGLEYLQGTSTAYAASTTGMYKTTDDGATWAAETLPIGVTEVNFVRFNGANAALAGGPAGVLVRYVGSQPVGTVAVTAPNGGENWTVGTSKNITWTSSNVANVKIEYSTNNGTNWTTVAATVPSTPATFAWTVPNTPATQCLVKVSDVTSAAVSDVSNATFTISAAVAAGWTSVTSGTTGDIWGIDYLDANNVWICSSTGDVKKSTDGGATFTAAGNAGEGAYSIALLNPTTAVVCLGPSAGDGKIMRTTDGGTTWSQVYTTAGAWFNFIDNLDANNAWALSDPIGGVFHIVKTTDGGATWSLTQNRPTAPASNVYGANNAWYAIGNTLWFGTGGATGATAANKLYRSTTGFDGPWTVATATAQFTGSMAFSSANGKGLVGFWQATNTMNKSTDGGVTLSALTTTNGLTHGLEYLQGTSTAYAASTTGMYKTTDDGATWAAETLPIGVTELNFVRFNSANAALAGGPAGVLVRYAGGSAPVGTVAVTAPNGGENWTVGTSKNITWTSSDVTAVKIEYTTNNGTNWSTVAASVPASPATFAWTVPNTPATQCKVKVSDASNTSISDQSNNVFTITAAGPVITWQHVINVKDNGTDNKDLTFGLSPNATNGIDVALGEAPLPPVPPTGVFDTRLELPVTPAEYSLKDFRHDSTQSTSWVVKFQASSAGYPVTLTWNPATLPSGSFMLKDNITGTLVSVDMKSQSSYVLTNTGITALKIEFSGRVCKDVVLAAGWNILSVPVTATSMATAVLFPSASSPAYGYNSNYVMSSSLTLGKGYFLRYPQAATISVCGNPTTTRAIAVNAGWNIIGAYDFNAAVSGITTTPGGILTSPFYGYSAGYQQASSLNTGKGYWVRASQAGTINLPTGLVKEGDAIAEAPIDKSWGKIIITDADGKSSVLYTSSSTVKNASLYELPPVPPTGVFDVRFSNNQLVEHLGGNQVDVVLQSAVYPIQVRAEGVDFQLTDKATGGKLVSSMVQSGKTVVVSHEGANVLQISSTELPVSYALDQNYPNPFNPSTTIRFSLPEKTQMSLIVYNQLGQKVAELFRGEKDAGVHQVEWNAANLPSGVYMYEMKTEKFSSIKKLILMK